MGTGLTDVVAVVASVAAAKNDVIDQALDCALEFYQMEMYIPCVLQIAPPTASLSARAACSLQNPQVSGRG